MQLVSMLIYNLKTLHDNGGGSTSTIADSGDTLLSLLEGVDQGDDDSAAGGSDGLTISADFGTTGHATYVAKRDGTTSDVDLLSGQTKDLLSTNGNDREGLVELPERDVVFRDTGLLEGEGDGEGGGGGEVDGGSGSIGVACSERAGLVALHVFSVPPPIPKPDHTIQNPSPPADAGHTAVWFPLNDAETRLTKDLGQGLQALLLDNIARSEHNRTGTVVECRRVGGGDGPVLLDKRRLERPVLVLQKLLVLLVLLDDDISLSRLDRDRGDLVVEEALLPAVLGSLVRRQAVLVLLVPADLVLLGRVLGAVAHGKLVVHVKQAVDDERVARLKVAERGRVSRDEEAGVSAPHVHGTARRTGPGTCSPFRPRP